MTEFLCGLIKFSTQAHQWYGTTLDSLIHPTLYYKTDRDVLIINAIRSLYASVFKKQAIPMELRYAHEEGDIGAYPTAPPEGYYRPPYDLPKEYSIRQVDSSFSDNISWNECRNAVLMIQGYLTQLNKDADSFFNTTLTLRTYGHRNDAVRFIGVLLMNAFVYLSKMDLNRKQVLEEADGYIKFLMEIKHHQEIFKLLELVNPNSDNMTPIAVLDKACQYLQNIRTIIQFHISKCSILEHTQGLHKEINRLIHTGFTYSAYSLSCQPIKETDIVISETPLTKVDAATDWLGSLRGALSASLAASQRVGGELARTVEAMALPDLPKKDPARVFYYDERCHQWVGISSMMPPESDQSLYKRFDASQVQGYLKFCGLLKITGQLCNSITHLELLLRTGGDLMAVDYFMEPIRYLLEMVEKDVGWILENYQTLSRATHAEHSRLCAKTKREPRETQWMMNYNHLQQLMQPEDLEKISQDVLGQVGKIHIVLQQWIENPRQKIEKVIQHRRILLTNLYDIGTWFAQFSPQYQACLPALAASRDKALVLLNAPHVTRKQLPLGEKTVSDKPLVSEIMERSKESNMQTLKENDTGVAKTLPVKEAQTPAVSENKPPAAQDAKPSETKTPSAQEARPSEMKTPTAPANVPDPKLSPTKKEKKAIVIPKSGVVVQQFKTWINTFSSKDNKHQGAFVAFFEEVLFVRKPWFERKRPMNRFRAYHHQFLSEASKTKAEKLFWSRVSEALGNPSEAWISWAKQVTHGLLKWVTGAAEAPLVTQQQKAITDGQTDNQTKAGKFWEEKFKVIGEGWPEKVRERLVNVLQKEEFKPEKMQGEVFLNGVATCLFQKTPLTTEEQNALDDCLREALIYYHQELTTNKTPYAYWESIIRGLVVLGANPLKWLQETEASTAEGMMMHRLLSQQMNIVLSHLLHRASALGDSMAYIKKSLQALTEKISQFSEELFACEEGWWRSCVGFVTRSPDLGAREARTVLLWSIVDWMAHCMNEPILQTPENSHWAPALQAKWDLMQKHLASYTEIGQQDRWTRATLPTLNGLKQTIEAMQEVLSSLGMSRIAFEALVQKEGMPAHIKEQEKAIQKAVQATQDRLQSSFEKFILRTVKQQFSGEPKEWTSQEAQTKKQAVIEAAKEVYDFQEAVISQAIESCLEKQATIKISQK